MKQKLAMTGVLLAALVLLIGFTTFEDLSETPKVTYNAGGPFLYDRLFDLSVHHALTIEMTETEFQGMADDMLAYSAIDDRMRTDHYRHATFTYEDDVGKVTLTNVGIRTKGNTTRILPMENGEPNLFHFKLKFNETFDDEGSALYNQVKKSQTLSGLYELNFKFHMWSDETYIKEAYAYSRLASTGIVIPKVTFGHITFIVGEREMDYGLYTIIEPVDQVFLERRSLEDSDLYKCLWQNYGPATLEPIRDEAAVGIKDVSTNYRPAYDLKVSVGDDHDRLYDFIEGLNSQGISFLEENFNIDVFARYQAMAMLLGMPDDYWAMGNNYYLALEKDQTLFIPYDYDHVLGTGWGGEPGWDHAGIAQADIFAWRNLNEKLMGTPYEHPLVDTLMENEDFKELYTSYLRTYIEDTSLFSMESFQKFYDEAMTLYEGQVEGEIGGEWPSRITPVTSWYFKMKTASIQEQLILYEEGRP